MNDLKQGIYFILDSQPFEILEARHLKMQQRRPVMQTRIKNLISGKTIEKNFQQSDYFEEADIQKKKVKFLYGHRGEFWFSEIDDPARFKLGEDILKDYTRFLKPNTIIDALVFNKKIINIELPVKMDFKVIEAPPSTRGNTAQGGTKQVKLETGAAVNVPLFIEEGDVVRINTQTGEYAERVGKK